MQKYKILGADQKEYGPVTAEVLRQWIAQGRANARTLIQQEGSTEWKPLSSYPEFADLLTGSVPGTSIPPLHSDTSTVPVMVGPAKTSRLAIASLVCGILGFFCFPALAGVILGITALVKIGRSGGQLKGNGLAIAGLTISSLMLPVAIISFIIYFSPSESVERTTCVYNMTQIGLGIRLYANDHNGMYPTNLQNIANEIGMSKILWCPADTKHTPTYDWSTFDPNRNLSYEYLKPGLAESNALNQVIIRCPVHDNVLMGDGSVQMRNTKRQGESSR
jgi:hypothetical protein